MSNLHLIIHLQKTPLRSTYEGSIQIGPTSIPLSGLKFGPSEKVKGVGVPEFLKQKTFGDLVVLLECYSPQAPDPEWTRCWNEVGQLYFGKYLGSQLLSALPPNDQRSLHTAEGGRVVVVTSDAFIARLPWTLLAWNTRFALDSGWSIAFCNDIEFARVGAVSCPSQPRILFIAPEPHGQEATHASDHLEEISKASSPIWKNGLSKSVPRIRTVEQLRTAVQREQPDLVYYYGHAGVVDGGVKLAMEGPNGGMDLVSTIDLARLLKARENSPPKLVFINCCRGDAAGLTGIGAAMAGLFPALLTNLPTVRQDIARIQATRFWGCLLRGRISPEKALAEAYQAGAVEFRSDTALWIATRLYVRYGEWEWRNEVAMPANWEDILNRTHQFGEVTTAVTGLMNWTSFIGSAFVWAGDSNAGVDQFHNRLHLELEDQLRNTALVEEVRVAWPMVFDESVGVEVLFGRGIYSALNVSGANEIPGAVRKRTGYAGKKVLLYLRHQPIPAGQLTPNLLKAYLHWWGSVFLPALDKDQRCLLGISYIVAANDNGAWHHQLQEVGIGALNVQNGECLLLDPLGLLTSNDLIRFVRRTKFPIPEDRLAKVCQFIIQKTSGHYAGVIRILKLMLETGLPAGDLNAWYDAQDLETKT